MYLLASLIMQNFYKKVLQLIQSYKDVRYFWDQNSPFILNKFFWCKPLLLFSSTYWNFLLYKILKSSYNGSRIITMHYFWDQSGSFAPNKFFLEYYYYHFHLPTNPFHCAKTKKIFFQRIQLWGCANNGPKIAHFPK